MAKKVVRGWGDGVTRTSSSRIQGAGGGGGRKANWQVKSETSEGKRMGGASSKKLNRWGEIQGKQKPIKGGAPENISEATAFGLWE